jgi:hypothetical protein
MKAWIKKHWKKIVVYSVALDTFVYIAIPVLLALAYWLFGFKIELPAWMW